MGFYFYFRHSACFSVFWSEFVVSFPECEVVSAQRNNSIACLSARSLLQTNFCASVLQALRLRRTFNWTKCAISVGKCPEKQTD